MMNLKKVLTVSAFKDKNEIAFGQYIIDGIQNSINGENIDIEFDLNIFRAFTDNDRFENRIWIDKKIHMMQKYK